MRFSSHQRINAIASVIAIDTQIDPTACRICDSIHGSASPHLKLPSEFRKRKRPSRATPRVVLRWRRGIFKNRRSRDIAKPSGRVKKTASTPNATDCRAVINRLFSRLAIPAHFAVLAPPTTQQIFAIRRGRFASGLTVARYASLAVPRQATF